MKFIWYLCTLVIWRAIHKKSAQVNGATICNPPCLLVSNTSDIVAIDYNTAAVHSIISGLTRAVAVDVHFSLGYIFWSDVTEKNIKRFLIDTASTMTIITGIGVCDGLAVDWRTSQLYWTDTTYNKISVSDLNGNNQRTLISSGLDKPRAIALDLDHDLLIWTDWGSHPKIERASLSANQRIAIVTTNIQWPNGIELDKGNKRIFWVDARMDRIETVDYNGNNRKILFQQSGLHPFWVALIPPFLFFTDWNTHKEVHKLDATTGKVLSSYGINGGRPMGIVMYSSAKQPAGSHLCSQSNGQCSDLCLLKPGGYQCTCPTGISLNSDGKTCDYDMFYKTSSERFMIFAEAISGKIYQVPLAVPETPCHPLQINTNISRPVAVDYDPVEGKIYWSDVTLKLVARGLLNGSLVEVIAFNNVDTPDGLAIDYVGRNLYWTDAGTSKIEVARLDGSFRRSLVTSNIEKPRAIILDIVERKMYWSDWGSSPKIEQANMDSSVRKTLVSSGLVWVNSLSLDFQSRLLYWCDAKLDKIERVDFQGNNRLLILDLSLDNLHPFGLALSGDILYWSDWNSRSVYQYNMTSSLREVVVGGMGRPMELHIYDHTKTVVGSNDCSQLNGGCSHICLPNPSGRQCFCPEGVQLKPGDPLTCQGVKRCPQLHAPSHGSLEPCSNLPGKTCKFSCDRGSVLTGSTTRTCNSNGTWTGKKPHCNVTTCSALPVPSNGIRQICIGTTIEYYNTICLFSCYHGFNGFGSSSRNCLENGTWSGQDFHCLAVTCTPLSTPPRALLLTMSCNSTYASTCVFGCQSGYGSTDPNVARTCLQTGQWSGNPINCTDVRAPSFGVTCPASSILAYAERGRFSAQVNWTEPVATDNSGVPPAVTSNYQPPQGLSQGIHVIIYTAVDQSGNTATCDFTVKVVVINCTSLMVDPGGPLRMSRCGNHYGAQCNFSCTAGHRLNGSSSVSCVAPGNRPPGFWDNPLPTCQAIRCPSLSTPTNGVKTGCSGIVSELYDTHCSFTCTVGYNLIGSSIRRCLENGTWSGETSQCQVISCGPLVPPLFGAISPSSCLFGSNYSQTCGFTCGSPGFVLQGTPARVCGKTGQWTGLNNTRCRDNGPPSFSNTCPNNMVFYTAECSSIALVSWNEPSATDNSGHVSISYPGVRPPVNLSIGLYNVMYSATDSSGNRANCSFIVQVTRQSCPVLQPPRNGAVTSFSCGSSFGSQASFSCNKGYQVIGSRLRSCKSDGTWSGNTTLCNIVKCPAITTPTHGQIFPTQCKFAFGVYYGTHCSFMCNVSFGYRLQGPRNVSCRENGSWSADATKITCKDVQPPSIQCPPDMEISTEFGRPYARVTWQVPDPTDNSDEPLRLSGLLPPQALKVGKKHIVYTATDSAGLSESCTFSIVVKDLEPPKISSCPDNIHITSKKKMNKVLLPGVTVTDNVKVHLFTTSRQNGSEFTWGEHNVTYMASDVAGNVAKCHFQVIITDYTCPDLPAPLNGAKACETWLTGMFCTVHCNTGFGFANQPQPLYVCSPDGTWRNAKVQGKETPSLPDCSKTHQPKEAVINGNLHYLVDKCGGQNMNDVIAGNFIDLFRNSLFGMAGGCNEQCSVENVRVECGNQTEARRRREAADGKQTSRISLVVYFDLKSPLPSNASLLDLNQTSQQISNDLLEALKKIDLNLNISGVVIKYDSSKPPVFRLTSLVCSIGQVQRGTRCVNCPLGYFFNTTGCQACAVDEYQGQEGQTSCLSCPSGTTTFGKTASKWRKNCQEVPSPSSTEEQVLSKEILYSGIALGAGVFIGLIGLTIVCVRKHRVALRPMSRKDRRTCPFPVHDDMGRSNPTYVGTETVQTNHPFSMETSEFQTRSLCFDNANVHSEEDAEGAPEHRYRRLNVNQSEV